MHTTEQDFLETIEDMIQQAWVKAPGEHKTAADMLRWVSANFQAENAESSLSRREWAELFIKGIKPIDTVDAALEFWKTEFQTALGEQANGGNGQEIMQINYDRVRDFLYPSARSLTS